MIRTIFAFACSIVAIAAYGSAAQACISCDYTPEVLKAGEGGGRSSYEARPSKRVREYTDQRERRSSKKRIVKEESAPKPRKEASKDDAPTSTAKVAPVKSEAAVEHSAITTTGAAIANQVKAAITPEPTGLQTENSTISTATTAAVDNVVESKPIEHVAADRNIGCKKYFPSTGLTLSVPCE